MTVDLHISKFDLIINVLIVYCKVAEKNELVYYFHYATVLRPNSFHINKHCCLNNPLFGIKIQSQIIKHDHK